MTEREEVDREVHRFGGVACHNCITIDNLYLVMCLVVIGVDGGQS